ncbi:MULTISPECIES: hypothetical protein [unclassified Microcoleus]|uniref:hypothetical protein n=1 Tax=unclassified Microcoleus TaxID=2642155 RepID=UPI002FD79106
MSKLFDFLTTIAVNPQQQIAFVNEPDAVRVAFGLSETDTILVESKSSTKIAAVFANEINWLAVICCDPNPEDPFPDPDPEPEPEPKPNEENLLQK